MKLLTIVAVTCGVLCMLLLYPGNASAVVGAEMKALNQCVQDCKKATCIGMKGTDRAVCNKACKANCSGATTGDICLDPLLADAHFENAAGWAVPTLAGYNYVLGAAGIEEGDAIAGTPWVTHVKVKSNHPGMVASQFECNIEVFNPIFDIVEFEVPSDPLDGCMTEDENIEDELMFIDSLGIAHDPEDADTYAENYDTDIQACAANLGVNLVLNSNPCPTHLGLRCDYIRSSKFSNCTCWLDSVPTPIFTHEECLELNVDNTCSFTANLWPMCLELDGVTEFSCSEAVADPDMYDDISDFGTFACDGSVMEDTDGDNILDTLTIDEADCPTEIVKALSVDMQEHIVLAAAQIAKSLEGQTNDLVDSGVFVNELGVPYTSDQLANCALEEMKEEIQEFTEE